MLEFTFYDDDPAHVVVATDRSMHDVVASYATAPRPGLDEIVSARTAPADQWVGRPGVYYWQADDEPVPAIRFPDDVRPLGPGSARDAR